MVKKLKTDAMDEGIESLLILVRSWVTIGTLLFKDWSNYLV